MPRSLILLAFQATLDKVDYSFVHFGPPEIPSYELNRFVLSHVSGYPCVMFGFQDFLYQSFWHLEHTLPVE